MVYLHQPFFIRKTLSAGKIKTYLSKTEAIEYFLLWTYNFILEGVGNQWLSQYCILTYKAFKNSQC